MFTDKIYGISLLTCAHIHNALGSILHLNLVGINSTSEHSIARLTSFCFFVFQYAFHVHDSLHHSRTYNSFTNYLL
jgi:hypothetical protein